MVVRNLSMGMSVVEEGAYTVAERIEVVEDIGAVVSNTVWRVVDMLRVVLSFS